MIHFLPVPPASGEATTAPGDAAPGFGAILALLTGASGAAAVTDPTGVPVAEEPVGDTPPDAEVATDAAGSSEGSPEGTATPAPGGPALPSAAEVVHDSRPSASEAALARGRSAEAPAPGGAVRAPIDLARPHGLRVAEVTRRPVADDQAARPVPTLPPAVPDHAAAHDRIAPVVPGPPEVVAEVPAPTVPAPEPVDDIVAPSTAAPQVPAAAETVTAMAGGSQPDSARGPETPRAIAVAHERAAFLRSEHRAADVAQGAPWSAPTAADQPPAADGGEAPDVVTADRPSTAVPAPIPADLGAAGSVAADTVAAATAPAVTTGDVIADAPPAAAPEVSTAREVSAARGGVRAPDEPTATPVDDQSVDHAPVDPTATEETRPSLDARTAPEAAPADARTSPVTRSATVESPTVQTASAAASARGPAPTADAAGTPPATLARVLEAVERLENAPPPRTMGIELADEGLRLQIELRGREVFVTVHGDDEGSSLARDLQSALDQRGFSLGDLRRERGRSQQQTSDAQRDTPQRDHDRRPTTPRDRRSDGALRM